MRRNVRHMPTFLKMPLRSLTPEATTRALHHAEIRAVEIACDEPIFLVRAKLTAAENHLASCDPLGKLIDPAKAGVCRINCAFFAAVVASVGSKNAAPRRMPCCKPRMRSGRIVRSGASWNA